MADEKTVHPGKVRQCWVCGADMGFIQNRHFDSSDTCGKRECEREARNSYAAAREEALDRVDDDFNGSW